MFYAHIILAKKGPLARIWLAAHWDKKITKAHVFETNIEKSVEGIMQPKVKLALRTSGHLLLGVVRIYSRKAKYLLADCNEAFVKIKMAFRPGMVDLPEGHREANVNAITLPEVFHDFDTALPELNDIDIEAQFSINQSRADEITMREDYGSLSLSLHDDGFGDIGFDADTPDLMRGPLSSNINDDLFEDQVIADVPEENITLTEAEITNTRLENEGFDNDFGQPELFGDDLFGEPALEANTEKVNAPELAAEESNDGADHFNDGPPSPASSVADYENNELIERRGLEEPDEENKENSDHDKENHGLDNAVQPQEEEEEESFALAPIDASALKGVTKAKRKRKLIVDEVKNISGEEMKAQLANTSDIVTTLDLAPPTKRLMYWKETGGVEKLFALPTRTIPARVLLANYNRNLLSHFTQLEDFSCLGPSDLLALDHIQNENDPALINTNKRGRKRKSDILPATQAHVDTLATDVTSNSIMAPEVMREQERSAALSRVSLNVDGNVQDSLLPGAGDGGSIFEPLRSPGPLFAMNPNSTSMENLHDMPMTPGQMGGGIDHSDDFPQGHMTPVGLNHGQYTPHHGGIETLESIPNLPSDQVSSILHEAENMPPATDDLAAMQRSDNIASDWNDFDFPPHIGIQTGNDEYLENETTEQFEERVLNKRAAQMFYAVKNRMSTHESIMLSELTIRNSRKQAAQKFYSLLVLKKFRALNITQAVPYSDIIITRGPMFENPKL